MNFADTRRNLRITAYLIRRQFKMRMYYSVNFLLNILGTLVDLAVMAIIAFAARGAVSGSLAAYGGDYFSYVVLGMVSFRILDVAINAPYSAVSDAFWNRRIELFLSSPVNPTFLIASLSFGIFVNELLPLTAYLIVGLALGFSTKILSWLWMPTLLLAFLACLGIGLMSAGSLYLLETKGQMDPIRWVMNILTRIVAGLYYPLSILPLWMQGLSLIIPHTYALDAVRRLVLGGAGAEPTLLIHRIIPFEPILIDILVIFAFVLVTLPLGYHLIRLGFRKALMDGRLSWWS